MKINVRDCKALLIILRNIVNSETFTKEALIKDTCKKLNGILRGFPNIFYTFLKTRPKNS